MAEKATVPGRSRTRVRAAVSSVGSSTPPKRKKPNASAHGGPQLGSLFKTLSSQPLKLKGSGISNPTPVLLQTVIRKPSQSSGSTVKKDMKHGDGVVSGPSNAVVATRERRRTTEKSATPTREVENVAAALNTKNSRTISCQSTEHTESKKVSLEALAPGGSQIGEVNEPESAVRSTISSRNKGSNPKDPGLVRKINDQQKAPVLMQMNKNSTKKPVSSLTKKSLKNCKMEQEQKVKHIETDETVASSEKVRRKKCQASKQLEGDTTKNNTKQVSSLEALCSTNPLSRQSNGAKSTGGSLCSRGVKGGSADGTANDTERDTKAILQVKSSSTLATSSLATIGKRSADSASLASVSDNSDESPKRTKTSMNSEAKPTCDGLISTEMNTSGDSSTGDGVSTVDALNHGTSSGLDSVSLTTSDLNSGNITGSDQNPKTETDPSINEVHGMKTDIGVERNKKAVPDTENHQSVETDTSEEKHTLNCNKDHNTTELSVDEDAVSVHEVVTFYIKQAKGFEKKGELARAMQWYKDAAFKLLPDINEKLESRIVKLQTKMKGKVKLVDGPRGKPIITPTRKKVTTSSPSKSVEKSIKSNDATHPNPPSEVASPSSGQGRAKQGDNTQGRVIQGVGAQGRVIQGVGAKDPAKQGDYTQVRATQGNSDERIVDPLQDIFGQVDPCGDSSLTLDVQPSKIADKQTSTPGDKRRTLTSKCARESLLASIGYKESARKRLDKPTGLPALDLVANLLESHANEVAQQDRRFWKRCAHLVGYLQQAQRLVCETLSDSNTLRTTALREQVNCADEPGSMEDEVKPKKSVSFCSYDTTVVVHPIDGQEKSSAFSEELLCILDQAVSEEQKMKRIVREDSIDADAEIMNFVQLAVEEIESHEMESELSQKLVEFIAHVFKSNIESTHEAKNVTEADGANTSFLRGRLEQLLDSLLRHLLRRAFNVPPGPRNSNPVTFDDQAVAQEWSCLEQNQLQYHLWPNEQEGKLTSPQFTDIGEPTVSQVCTSPPTVFQSENDVPSTVVSTNEVRSIDPPDQESNEMQHSIQLQSDEQTVSDGEDDDECNMLDRLMIQQNSGSCVYNCDDLASLIHRALRCIYYLQPVAQSLTLVNDVESVAMKDLNDFDPVVLASVLSEDADIAVMLQLFANAHEFLASAFVDNETMHAMIDRDLECWGKLEHFLGIVRSQKVHDLKPLLPLGDLSRFVSKLKSMEPLVASAKETTKSLNRARTAKEQSLAQATNNPKSDATNVLHAKNSTAEVFVFPTLVSSASVMAGTAAMSKLLLCPKCNDTVGEINEGGEIVCGMCMQWLHLRCLGLPPDFPDTVTHFICEKCNLAIQNGEHELLDSDSDEDSIDSFECTEQTEKV